MTETSAPPRRLDLGDFQAPDPLARRVCDLVARSGFAARSILEPTCGVGAFVVAAAQAFPRATRILGSDINAAHVAVARSRVERLGAPPRVDLETADFFATDWQAVIGRLEGPALIVGNRPWVTNSELGALRSQNLPMKANLDGQRSIDALTGRSNFDISEWMLRTLIDAVNHDAATLAVLCKTSVARKVLAYAWSRDYPIGYAAIHRVEAFRRLCGRLPSARAHRGAGDDQGVRRLRLTGRRATRQQLRPAGRRAGV